MDDTLIPLDGAFVRLSTELDWSNARRMTNDPLVSSDPDECYALLVVNDPGSTAVEWALLRCPMKAPYSLIIECCGPQCPSDTYQPPPQRSLVMESVRRIAYFLDGYNTQLPLSATNNLTQSSPSHSGNQRT